MEVWEYEKCCGNMSREMSVSTTFSCIPKLPEIFLKLDSNTENMFSISCKNVCVGKKETHC